MTKKTPIKKPAARKQTARQTPAASSTKNVTTTKKATVKAARPPARKTAVRAAVEAATVYQFDTTKTTVPRVSAIKTGNGPSLGAFASFEDVKDRAIDFLIDYIADCEQQLWDLKRAESFEAYTALLAESERQKI